MKSLIYIGGGLAVLFFGGILVISTYFWWHSRPKITVLKSVQAGKDQLELVGIYVWNINLSYWTLGWRWNGNVVNTRGYVHEVGDTESASASDLPEAQQFYTLKKISDAPPPPKREDWLVWLSPKRMDKAEFERFGGVLGQNLTAFAKIQLPTDLQDRDIWQKNLDHANKFDLLGIRQIGYCNPDDFKPLTYTYGKQKIEVDWSSRVSCTIREDNGGTSIFDLGYLNYKGDTLFLARTWAEVDDYEATGKFAPHENEAELLRGFPTDLSLFKDAAGKAFTERFKVEK